MGKRIPLLYLLGWILFVLGSCTDNSSVSPADAGTRSGERGEENDEATSSEGSEGTGAANMSGAENSGQPEPSDVDDCASRCNDGFSCTNDSCRDGDCVYTFAPLDDPGACPSGEYCTLEQGCVAAPPCAEDLDCEEAWADDACKQSPRCDAASSVCVFSILDKDGDSHAPQVCGGDDCNDDSFDLRPGREETCDGVDDDCDGIVDEQALCSERTTCVDGECRCLPEFLCGTSCPDKATSVNHCGECNNACPSDGECEDGVCGCPEDYVLCGDACIDVQDDWQNCGACENVCINGCDNGVCFCPEGEAYCNGACVDITSDELNCGACDHDCSSEGGNACAAGFCILAGDGAGTGEVSEPECPLELALCDEQCVDLLSDMVNCGDCGNVCCDTCFCDGGVCVDSVLIEPAFAVRSLVEYASEKENLNSSTSFQTDDVEGSPPPALRVEIPFTNYNQFMEFEYLAVDVNDDTAWNLTDKILTLNVKVEASGYTNPLCPGGIRFFVKTGDAFTFAQRSWITTPPSSSEWKSFEFDVAFAELAEGVTAIDLADVRAVGLTFETADCGAMFLPGDPPPESDPPTTAIFYLDGIRIEDAP